MNDAIAITGTGLITAQGIGVQKTWQGIVESRDVLRPWQNAPANHPLQKLKVAQCPPLPRPEDLPPRLWNKLSKTQQFACIALDEALRQSNLPHQLGAHRVGIFLATTVCGMDLNEQYYAQYRQNQDTADIHLLRRVQPFELAELIARRHHAGLTPGLRQTCLTTCVGSAMAIGNAMDAIALGECDIAIAGGAEALCRVVLAGFHSLKVVAPDGCRPFDENRPGITVGEGAGILILERADHARRRGATPLAYLRGFAATCDAHHLTAPDPDAKQAARAIQEALERAGIDPDQVGYINAHGTGTRDNDAMESRALQSVFDKNIPPVSSTKRSTGHTFGAAGAIEAILCIQALRENLLPPNAGSVTPDPTLNIPIIRGAPMRSNTKVALSTNFAFGGNNTALVFSITLGSLGETARSASENTNALAIISTGLATDTTADASSLDPATIAQHDTLTGLVLSAIHLAWGAAGMQWIPSDRIALLFVSCWGNIDATVAYLDSMLESEGRYTSPRHFSRSVNSSVASLAAIHFKIHGPCQTLAFAPKDSAPNADLVNAATVQAHRLLAAHRADRVIIVWAEQSAELAEDLARRAAETLHRGEFQRYLGKLGQGAIALIVGRPESSGAQQIALEQCVESPSSAAKHFAVDGAMGFVQQFRANKK